MTARVFMSAADQAKIEAHARDAYPYECCGLLIGASSDTGSYHVTRTLRSDNVTEGDPKCTFEIDPALLIRTQKELRDSREDLIGYYHSHPDGPAHPSETDRISALEAAKIWIITANPIASEKVETNGFLTEGDEPPLTFKPVRLLIGAHFENR